MLAIGPLVEQIADANAMQWARICHITYVYASSWFSNAWSQMETVNGRPHLIVYGSSSLSAAKAAPYIARQILLCYEEAGSPPVTLGGDLADVAATQALQKQMAAEAKALANPSKAAIDKLVGDGLAFRDQDGDVYVATLAADSVILLVYQYITSRYSDTNHYQLLKSWHLPIAANENLATQLASLQSAESAKQHIDAAEFQRSTDFFQSAAEAVTFIYHALPFGAAYDNAAEGHYWEATLSLLGDVAFFAGGPLLKFAGEGTVLAKALVITSIAAETTIGVTRAKDAYFAFQAGDKTAAAGYMGEAMLRLLGASVTAVSQLKGVTKAVHNAAELFNEAILTGCFAAGTPVLTPSGARCIEDFRPGDQVLSRDESEPDGAIIAKVVEAVVTRTARVLHLHVGGEVIRTSTEHPFWVHGRGWLPASQLGIGDLLVSHDGQVKLVEDVLQTGEYETVYNMRVADFHTYFVGGEAWGFSVWRTTTTSVCPPFGTASSMRCPTS